MKIFYDALVSHAINNIFESLSKYRNEKNEN